MLKSGMPQRKEESGIVNMPKDYGKTENQKQKLVKYVGINIKPNR